MPKKLERETRDFVRSTPWTEGDIVEGFLFGRETVSVSGADPWDKVLFDQDGTGKIVAKNIPAVLAQYLKKMTLGKFYAVKCLGKVVETSKGNAFDFDVMEYSDDEVTKKFHGSKKADVAVK